MSTTIASAFVPKKGELAILIDAAEANSFFDYLRTQGVTCFGPSPVIWRPRRVTRNAMGKINIEEDTLECEILAQGTLDDFANWISNWIAAQGGR